MNLNHISLLTYNYNAVLIQPPTFPDNKKHVTAQNNATPSIKADIISAVVLISPAASGCLPVASAAAAVILPIPNAAPIVTKPAPKPAPIAINPTSLSFSFLFYFNDVRVPLLPYQ